MLRDTMSLCGWRALAVDGVVFAFLLRRRREGQAPEKAGGGNGIEGEAADAFTARHGLPHGGDPLHGAPATREGGEWPGTTIECGDERG